MDLIERADFLVLLHGYFRNVTAGEGHCIFISGEAGIGKTALVKTFCKELKLNIKIYQGTCDALFTPRPLAPLYDIFLQLQKDLPENSPGIAERTELFTKFFQNLKDQNENTVVVFEDIHWADEATLDFIKFFARRITQLRCLFVLTYRDDEIHSHYPLRNILGQLPPDTFTRMPLRTLSRQAVEKMADEKGYRGEDVYSISNGNPFYVNEILASYSMGIPDNIKDAVLSVFGREDNKAKHIWQLLSVIPTSFETKYLEKIEPLYATAIENCLEKKILILQDGMIFFKHELYRRTIEASLSPLLRITLNKRILDLFRETFEQSNQIERIVHHAKNANEYDVVVKYAPLAAKQAASVGAHIEASKLYLTAIEYYQGNEKSKLIQFYEAYAYECYLTNQFKEAIIYMGRSMNLWREINDPEKIASCMRLLSRLWWFEGNWKNAESYASQAIEVLEKEPSSAIKAMAFSNMSQLKMLSDQTTECLFWGEKAIAMAKEMNDDEILCHALNNVGTMQMRVPFGEEYGKQLLEQSLAIALKHAYPEHVARAYTNLGSNLVVMKKYADAKKALESGMQFCDGRDLNSWACYMASWKARCNLGTGHWKEAYAVADTILKNESQSAVAAINALVVITRIKVRKGEPDVLPFLLDSKSKAIETQELQRIIPSMSALLEYEWIHGKKVIDQESLDCTIAMIEQRNNSYEDNEFAFWLCKARKYRVRVQEIFEGYFVSNKSMARKAAATWEKIGAPYEQALTLFEGDDDDKRKAVTIIFGLGATAVFEKMKSEMRGCGIKSIPRGIRKSTQSNTALLTSREMDILALLRGGLQNKEIAARLFISAKTVDHHISAILFKLDVNSRVKAVHEAVRLEIIK